MIQRDASPHCRDIPDAGSRGGAVDMTVGFQNRAAAEADAGHDALKDARSGIGRMCAKRRADQYIPAACHRDHREGAYPDAVSFLLSRIPYWYRQQVGGYNFRDIL